MGKNHTLSFHINGNVIEAAGFSNFSGHPVRLPAATAGGITDRSSFGLSPAKKSWSKELPDFA